MQKITRLMRDAFMSNTNFKMDNTEVITTCGWPTRTTKDRLNALPNVHIHQLKGMWYLNGEKWDGSSTSVYA